MYFDVPIKNRVIFSKLDDLTSYSPPCFFRAYIEYNNKSNNVRKICYDSFFLNLNIFKEKFVYLLSIILRLFWHVQLQLCLLISWLLLYVYWYSWLYTTLLTSQPNKTAFKSCCISVQGRRRLEKSGVALATR